MTARVLLLVWLGDICRLNPPDERAILGRWIVIQRERSGRQLKCKASWEGVHGGVGF
jgi:hypothetical protein